MLFYFLLSIAFFLDTATHASFVPVTVPTTSGRLRGINDAGGTNFCIFFWYLYTESSSELVQGHRRSFTKRTQLHAMTLEHFL